MRAALPAWACDAIHHEAGRIELEGYVARHFGYRFRPDVGFEPAALPPAVFKVRRDTDPADVVAARGYATAVARSVARATRTPWTGMPPDAAGLRVRALEAADGRGWVDFAALVEASWRLGIPVIDLPELPVLGRKPDGLATFVGGRPVAVLLKSQPLAEWMVFILAHELGHMALGHLSHHEGAAVVDEKVSLSDEAPTPIWVGPEDDQERDANAFASAVLVPGGTQLTLGPPPWRNAEALAALAIQFGRKHGICPGHAVLNAVKNTTRGGKKPFALGMAALKVLHQTMDARTTAEVCRDAARRHLDLNAVRPDTAEFLEKVGVV